MERGALISDSESLAYKKEIGQRKVPSLAKLLKYEAKANDKNSENKKINDSEVQIADLQIPIPSKQTQGKLLSSTAGSPISVSFLHNIGKCVEAGFSWALKNESIFSLNSATKIGQLFQKMFPEGKIVQKFLWGKYRVIELIMIHQGENSGNYSAI